MGSSADHLEHVQHPDRYVVCFEIHQVPRVDDVHQHRTKEECNTTQEQVD